MGTNDCVALVQFYARAPNHRQWKAGEPVLDNPAMRPGTAIATFVKGRYPNNATGQHAALFLRHGPKGDGFWVMDQWKDKPGQRPRSIEARYIRSQHRAQNKDGTWYWASDNADAFSIIELR